MSDLNDLLANAPPELIDALISAAQAGGENDLQSVLFQAAQKKAATPQPGVGSFHSPFGEVLMAAPPLAHIASTLQNVMGQKEASAAMQQMQANLLRGGTAARGLLGYQKAAQAARQQPQQRTPSWAPGWNVGTEEGP